MTGLVVAFVAATLAWTGASLYLSWRQSACVRRHADAVPADFAASISQAEHAKAAAYTLARERLSRIEIVADSLLTLAWTLGGIELVYGLLARAIGPSIGRGVAFLAVTGAVASLVGLPFAVYRAFWLEAAFGFNKTTPRTFVIDRLKRMALSVIVGLPLLVALLLVMRHLSGLWWLYAWFGLLALMVAAPAVYMRFVAPRFNRFEPLPDGALRARIEALLHRSGFKSSGLYTMDASKRTAHGNAFFIGFGRTKRIVLFDTLIERTNPDEIEAVVAHELGHFLRRHVLFGLARAAAMSFVVLAAFGWLSRQPWLLPSFDITYRDDALALYVCLLLASIVGPLAAPIGNWISRRNEYEADDYARRTVGVTPMVGALVKLARDNASTLTPDPLYALVHHSHPTVPLRVRHMRAMERGGASA